MATQDNYNSYYDPSDDDTVTVELHSIDLITCPHCNKFVAAYSQRCPYCKQRIVAAKSSKHSWIFAASTAVLLTLLCAGLIGHYLGM